MKFSAARIAFLVIAVCLFCVSVEAQRKPPAKREAIAAKIRVAKIEDELKGALYAQIGGAEKKIADEAIKAWLINGGREIVFSATDGAGGFENEGQSLRIYNAATGKTRKIMSEYSAVDKVTEAKLTDGKTALLVEMSDGGLGASNFAVVDPLRGEVLSRQLTALKKHAGDFVSLETFGENDWAIINEGTAAEKSKVKPSKTERLDLKKVLKNKVIINKPTNG